jgi:hypothetical protein
LLLSSCLISSDESRFSAESRLSALSEVDMLGGSEMWAGEELVFKRSAGSRDAPTLYRTLRSNHCLIVVLRWFYPGCAK